MARTFQNKLLAVKIGLLEEQRSNLQTVMSATDKVLSLANDWTRNADEGSDATFKDLNCMIEDMILFLGCKYTQLPAFCANASDSTGGLFGGASQANTGSLFGGASQANTGSLFGGASQANTGSLFGGASQANTGSLFGGASQAKTGSLFGGASQANIGSLFGGTTQANTGSLFGVASQANTGSLFGGTSQANTGSLFGGTSQANTGSLFGGTSQANTGSLFGGASQANTGSLFGGASQANTGSLFGGASQANTGSLFGGASRAKTGSLFGGTSQANTGSLFGGASQANTGSLFGGASQANTGSLFGGTSQANTGSLFGEASQANTGSLFGGASQANTGSLFGGASQANTGSLFGGASQANTGSLFGGTGQANTGISSLISTSAAGTGFGVKPGSFTGFGTSTGQTGSSLFGTNTTAIPLFGQTFTTPAFEGASAGKAADGTTVPFNPPNGQDIMMRSGVTTNINTKHQCITAMKEYENKSLEELRMEDYSINHKYKLTLSLFGQTPSTQATTGFVIGHDQGSGTGQRAHMKVKRRTMGFRSELTGIETFNKKKIEKTTSCLNISSEKISKQKKKKKKNLKKMCAQKKKKNSKKMQQKQPEKEEHFEKAPCLDYCLQKDELLTSKMKAFQTVTRIAKKVHIDIKENNYLIQKKIIEQKETNDKQEKQLEKLTVALDNILDSIQVLCNRVGLLETKAVDHKQFSDVQMRCEIQEVNSENMRCNLDDHDTQLQELASKVDEASKNIMLIPQLKNEAEEKLNAFEEEWSKSKEEVGSKHKKELEELTEALDTIFDSIQVLGTRIGILETKAVDNKQFSDVQMKCEILQVNSENVRCNLDDLDTQLQELAGKVEEASKNITPVPELKNLQKAEDKINAFQEEWSKSKEEVGKLHNDFEIKNKILCQIIADRLAPLQKLIDIFNKRLDAPKDNVKKNPSGEDVLPDF